jgi:hypothetical protein
MAAQKAGKNGNSLKLGIMRNGYLIELCINLQKMARIAFILLFFSMNGMAQWKEYKLTQSGDTINRVGQDGKREGPWLNRVEALRGEPGFEEEGSYQKGRKEGEWRLYSLQGDLMAIENYRWGLKDGTCRYFTSDGSLKSEQGWKALDPDKEFDTVDVEDPDHPDTYKQVAIRNEGASIKHGLWRYYNTRTGMIIQEQAYQLGKLEPALSAPSSTVAKPLVDTPKISTKPKEVMEFEKKNEGKKRVKVRDGSTSGE